MRDEREDIFEDYAGPDNPSGSEPIEPPPEHSWPPSLDEPARLNDPAPGPWIIPVPGQVYSQPLYVSAPFMDTKGVRHEDYMAGLVALVYGGPETTALVAEAPTLKEQRDELLAALDGLVTTYERLGDCLDVEAAMCSTEWHTALDVASAAIAKARRDTSKGRT